MGFINITDEDVQPYRTRNKNAKKNRRKLDENLDETSKAVESLSTTDAEAIELMEIKSKDYRYDPLRCRTGNALH